MRELNIIETLMLCFTLLSFVFSSLIFYIHNSRRKSFKGDIFLGIALILFSVGFLINTFTLLGTPQLSMTISNIFGVMGYVVFNWGTRKFRSIRVKYQLDLISVGIYTLLYLFFMYINELKTVRLMITSLFLTFYTILILYQYQKFSERNTIIQVIKLAFSVFLLINIYRATTYLISIFNGNYNLNVFVEITWLIDLLLTEFVVVTGLLIVRDQDELQDKSMLLSVLGHDLKTPLINVHNLSTILLEKGLDEEDKELVEMCKRASRNGMNLLSNIIEWTTFDMHNLKPDKTLSVLDFKKNMQNYFIPQEEVYQVQVDFNVTEDFNLPIDERILHTILRNIIGNAIQYSPKNSVVTVKIYKCNRTICFEVIDTGDGIPKDQMQRLNSNFNNLKPRSNTAKGSGLGFYIIRKFVIAIYGTIELKKNEPHGTIFKLSIPA